MSASLLVKVGALFVFSFPKRDIFFSAIFWLHWLQILFCADYQYFNAKILVTFWLHLVTNYGVLVTSFVY